MQDKKSPVIPNTYQCRRLVGQLLYLGFTQPHLAHATQQVSQYVHSPKLVHWNAALHVAKYLKNAPSLGHFYSSSNDLSLSGFCYVDWGTCTHTRFSLTGFCIFLGNSLIS